MEGIPFDPGAIIRLVKVKPRDITSNLQKFYSIGANDQFVMQDLQCLIVPVSEKRPCSIVWEKPALDNFKLNMHGSSYGNSGASGEGGVIRDAQGRVLAGFSQFFGHANNTIVECRALLDGLRLCHEMGLRDIWWKAIPVWWLGG